MIERDRRRPHYHVIVTEDEEIRTFRTPAEARAHLKELRQMGWSASVETCGRDCPILYNRPFDSGQRDREEPPS